MMNEWKKRERQFTFSVPCFKETFDDCCQLRLTRLNDSPGIRVSFHPFQGCRYLFLTLGLRLNEAVWRGPSTVTPSLLDRSVTWVLESSVRTHQTTCVLKTLGDNREMFGSLILINVSHCQWWCTVYETLIPLLLIRLMYYVRGKDQCSYSYDATVEKEWHALARMMETDFSWILSGFLCVCVYSV